MADRTHIWFLAVVSLVVAVTTAVGQEEQWLQYNFERDAYRIIVQT